MANKVRGEVEVEVMGQPVRLLLTLGAVAEIEDAFDMPLSRVGLRMAEGFRVRDFMIVFRAMAEAGGTPITADEMKTWPIDAMQSVSSSVTKALDAQFGDDKGNVDAGAAEGAPAIQTQPHGMNGSGSVLAP